MSTNDEARRAALEARTLVREIGTQMRADDRRGRELRSADAARVVVSEEMAWALLYGVEPRLGVDEEGAFYTITGLGVLHADDSADYMGLFGSTPLEGHLPLQAQTLDPTIPFDRWSRFLASDDSALGCLSRLEEIASDEGVEVPEDFALLLRGFSTSQPPADAVERVRHLAYLLTSRDEECLGLAAELSRRRAAFVWGPEGPPWAGRNK